MASASAALETSVRQNDASPPSCSDALRGRLAELGVDVAHEHVGSGGGEHASGRLAHAHRRSGDDRNLAVQHSCRHLLHPPIWH